MKFKVGDCIAQYINDEKTVRKIIDIEDDRYIMVWDTDNKLCYYQHNYNEIVFVDKMFVKAYKYIWNKEIKEIINE